MCSVLSVQGPQRAGVRALGARQVLVKSVQFAWAAVIDLSSA